MLGPFATRDWLDMPFVTGPCAPGLDHLTALDRVVCHHLLESFPQLNAIDSNNNRYILTNTSGEPFLFALECYAIGYSPKRGFSISVVDCAGTCVASLNRPFKKRAGRGVCCKCCKHEVTVEAPPSRPVAKVIQKGKKKFKIFGRARDMKILVTVPGKFDMPQCVFPVSIDGQAAGEIIRYCRPEPVKDSEAFSASFPMDLEPALKLAVLGCAFLLNVMYFDGASKPIAPPPPVIRTVVPKYGKKSIKSSKKSKKSKKMSKRSTRSKTASRSTQRSLKSSKKSKKAKKSTKSVSVKINVGGAVVKTVAKALLPI